MVKFYDHGADRMSKWGQDAERIAALRAQRQSDTERWSSLDNHNEGWVNRVRMALKFIPPNSAVVEVGAGRAFMRDLLPEGCTYVPADLVAHQPDFIELDLNTNDWHLPDSDVLVALGTMEYVYDFPGVLTKLRATTRRIIFTYCSHVEGADPQNRMRQGWLTDFSQEEVEHYLDSAHLSVVKKVLFQDEVHFKQVMWVADRQDKKG